MRALLLTTLLLLGTFDAAYSATPPCRVGSKSYNTIVPEAVVITPTIIPVVIPATAFQWLPALYASVPAASPTVVYGGSSTSNTSPATNAAASNLGPTDDGPPVANYGTSTAMVSDSLVTATYQKHCGQCHGGGQARGGIRILDLQNRLAPSVASLDILKALSTRHMPPPGKPEVPADDLALMVQGLFALR